MSRCKTAAHRCSFISFVILLKLMKQLCKKKPSTELLQQETLHGFEFRNHLGFTSSFVHILSGRQVVHFVLFLVYKLPVKGSDTRPHLMVFLYLYYFLHCRYILKKSNI